jgi:hypothetical protein
MPTIAEILEQLRLRLLDLTSRNRLLNFKSSIAKSLQVVEAVPNAVYDRLLDGRACTFIPVPDPTSSAVPCSTGVMNEAATFFHR